MSVVEIMFKDRDGFHYKHPERSCNKCRKYPCIDNMHKLQGDFAKYGCRNYSDINVFNIGNVKSI